MKEKNKLQDALEKMKIRRGNDTIILFHNGDSFEAYGKDAQVIAEELGLITFTKDGILATSFSHDKQEEYTNRLLNKGYAVCISEMRDASGNFITNIAGEDE